MLVVEFEMKMGNGNGKNGKWKMQICKWRDKVEAEAEAVGIQVGVDLATALCVLQPSAWATNCCCTTDHCCMHHAHHPQNLLKSFAWQRYQCLPQKPPNLPPPPGCHLQHTLWLSRRLSFVATGEKCNKLWQKCCSQTLWVVGGRQHHMQHMQHMKHKWSAIKCAKQKRQLTHATHTHHTLTHSMQKERGAREEKRRIAIEALSLCGCRRSRVASNSHKGAKDS